MNSRVAWRGGRTLNREIPDIRIVEQGAIRILQIGRIQQSSMYLDAIFDTDFDYPGYLHITVAVAPDAKRTLVIGLGGATVVKRMWRDYPEMHIDTVELEPRVAELARTDFALPDDERISVYVGDGREFVESCSAVYDIVIVDAFDDDQVPRPLITEEFHRHVIAHLSQDGVLAYNMHGSVAGDQSRRFRRMHRTLRGSFRQVWTFPVRLSSASGPGAHSEIIILATNANLTTDELLGRIESRVDGRVSVPGFSKFGADLYRGEIRGGDVAPYCDGRG